MIDQGDESREGFQDDLSAAALCQPEAFQVPAVGDPVNPGTAKA